MTEQSKSDGNEEKSQAQLDYEAGQDFLQKNELAMAANAFHNALLAFEHDKNENGIANASDKLGDICAQRGDFSAAQNHFDRAYAICQKHSDRFSLFALEKKMAKLKYDAKDYAKAVTLYLDVLDEYSALRNPQGSVDTLDILAEIYLAMGEKKRAADAYRMAASIHSSFKHARHAEKYMNKAAEVENS